MTPLMDPKKYILITGGAGFIGSNIVERLVDLQITNIRILDNLSSGVFENISHLLHHNIEFIYGDICDYTTCLNATKNVEIICHQAALGSVPRSIKNPLDTHNTNSTGFMNILMAAKENNVKRVVYASSSSVYGDNTDDKKIETNIGTPLSPYAITKYTDELYANVFNKLYDIETIGLRYFNVFGPKQCPTGEYAAVIPKFINNMLLNKPIQITGDGYNSRDFTYVANVVYANLLAMSTDNKQCFGNVYNVGCGYSTSIYKLYKTIKNKLKINTIVTFTKHRQGDIKNSCANIEKANDQLSYYPIVNFENGLDETIQYYKNKL